MPTNDKPGELSTQVVDVSSEYITSATAMQSEELSVISLLILMPNGTVITLTTPSSRTFYEIKEDAFELAAKGPLYGALRNPGSYSFSYIDRSSSPTEIEDEGCRLCDAEPIGGIINVVEKKEDMATLELDDMIGRLIGKPLSEFTALRMPEVNDFRHKIRDLCEEIVKNRQNHSWLEKMRYAYPVSTETSTEVPKFLSDRLPPDGMLIVKVSFGYPNITLELSVHHLVTSDDVLTSTIRKLMCESDYAPAYQQLLDECECTSYYDTSFEKDDPSLMGTNFYLLKINGTLEYLIDNCKLIQYKMIRQFILNDQPIHLMAVRRNSIEFEDESIYSIPEFLPAPRGRSQSVISLGSLTNVLLNAKRLHNTFSSWSIDRKLVIRIHKASRINYGTHINRIAIMVGIFHGGEMLCDHFMTVPVNESSNLAKSSSNLVMLDSNTTYFTWDLDIVFNLKVSDLPRMARLCFSVVGFSGNAGSAKKLSKNQSGPGMISKPTAKLFWGNINFFDYKGILRENSTTLSLWEHEDDEIPEDEKPTNNEDKTDDSFVSKYFNPLGTVVQNPNNFECPLLTISFTKYSEGENAMIKYPDMREITRTYGTANNLASFPEETGIGENDMEQNGDDEEEEDSSIRRTVSTSSASSLRTAWASKQSLATADKTDLTPEPNMLRRHSVPKGHASKQFMKQISDFCDRDLLYRMSDQECELLWHLREDCKRALPNALNKLLLSFKWNNQKSVAQALSLLQDWPKIPPSKALELLDYAYADSHVRKYAIECLKDMTSDQLSHFLLQLVQALKYESYIYNDLVQFLLERAFENQRLGHQLFWLLRAEMHDPAVSVHFGLILEAYCRGAVDHIHILMKQSECLAKLRRINEVIRDDKSRESRDKKISQMQDILRQKFYQETLSHCINPLDPVYKLGSLKTGKCKFMDSKMKPLWLVYANADPSAGDIFLIFKNGDDLRQDMLTLQMIRIMDQMWKEEGLDLRMTPYKCVSLAKKVGLIEVVLNADTIANIQKEKGSAALAAFKKGSLYSWLKDHNPGEAEMKRAVEEFTLSCAGYCVATYILGIADRHSDNIMVKKNGQLFHIDFGHILGKFKEKFGIRRERVPFVLTHDFVYVITNGKQAKADFERFQNVCEQAFLIIRRRGNFIISLFAMMLSTGIPEVSSVDDLKYLRETLVLDLTEEAARIVFREKFNEALKNGWKTSFNWCAHSLAKDNRMSDA